MKKQLVILPGMRHELFQERFNKYNNNNNNKYNNNKYNNNNNNNNNKCPERTRSNFKSFGISSKSH